jgi:SAP domain-containing ribonucleoprotein
MSHHSGISNHKIEAEAAPPAPTVTSAPPQQTTETIAQEPVPEVAPTTVETVAPAADASADAATDATLAASTNYSLHLPNSNVDDEIAKRKARAARFGTANQENAGDDETEDKNLERAKRFGIQASDTAMGKLDVALSTEGPKVRRRGPAKEGDSAAAAFDDPGLLRRGRGGRFRGRGRGRREGSAGARPTGVEKSGPGYSDRDRAAADARKKRFAQQG